MYLRTVPTDHPLMKACYFAVSVNAVRTDYRWRTVKG